jgi:SAM-dependent methyltransferase
MKNSCDQLSSGRTIRTKSLVSTFKRMTQIENRFETCGTFFEAQFAGGDILEIGAGSGVLARYLMSLDLGIRSYTATDYSEDRVHLLSQNCTDEGFAVLKMDAENIPDLHGKYDAVVMLHVIEHLVNPIKTCLDIRKTLKPGGFLYIETPNIAKYTRRVKLLCGWFPGTGGLKEGLRDFSGRPVTEMDCGHLHYFTYRSLSAMLKEYCGYSGTVKLFRFTGGSILRKVGGSVLARTWPEMFSDVVLVAFV